MNLIPTRPLIALSIASTLALSGCGTVESAAQDDCTSIGWRIGTPGYEDCFKARVRERNMDYAPPQNYRPSPSVI
jgi:hypothetical protein